MERNEITEGIIWKQLLKSVGDPAAVLAGIVITFFNGLAICFPFLSVWQSR